MSRRSKAPPKKGSPPKCPDYLAAPAKAKWKELVRDLKNAGILAKSDVDTMARYCAEFATWQKANDMIQRAGELLKGPNGGLIQNPWLAIRKHASAQMHKISLQLGLDPISRQRLHVEPEVAQKRQGVARRDRDKAPDA